MIAGPVMPRQLSLRVNLDDDATFDNFFVPSEGASGAAALAHLRARLGDWQSRRTAPAVASTTVADFTWLWGGRGAGSSHLLQAVCHAVTQSAGKSALQCFYLDFADFGQLHPDVLVGLEQQDILCLDHLDRIAGHPEWELALFNLYNALAQRAVALLVTAASSPQHLQWQLPDLQSRLQAAAVFHLHALDDRHKAAALQLRAQRRGFLLADEVAEYIVRRSERSMNSLFAILQQLDSHSLATGRKVSIPMIRAMMGW
jgi:DnaA family protein